MSDDDSDGGKGEKTERENHSLSVSQKQTVTDSLDSIFESLTNPRRRYLLYYLLEMNGNVAELDAAVNAVYKLETTDLDADASITREHVKTSLYHNHLPKLANSGIIDFDTRQGSIRFAENHVIEDWIEHARVMELD